MAAKLEVVSEIIKHGADKAEDYVRKTGAMEHHRRATLKHAERGKDVISQRMTSMSNTAS